MPKTINEARRDQLTRSFFGYRAEESPPRPEGFSEADWESLSPGMRREIARSATRTPRGA